MFQAYPIEVRSGANLNKIVDIVANNYTLRNEWILSMKTFCSCELPILNRPVLRQFYAAIFKILSKISKWLDLFVIKTSEIFQNAFLAQKYYF